MYHLSYYWPNLLLYTGPESGCKYEYDSFVVTDLCEILRTVYDKCLVMSFSASIVWTTTGIILLSDTGKQ